MKRLQTAGGFAIAFAALMMFTPFVPHAGQQTDAEKSADAPLSGTGCLGEGAVLEDFKRMRAELEAERKKISEREAELSARETAVNEVLKDIQTVRDQIVTMQQLRKAENEAQVAKLVETFETMSPKAAAKLLSTVDEGLAVATISRIETKRLAKIMNIMEPTKSSRLTELLTGVARASGKARDRAPSASNGAAEATPKERR